MFQTSRFRVALTVGAAVGAAAAAAPAADASSGHVTRVVDGDTIRVRVATGVRTLDLRGVDAPDEGECYAAAATSRLRRLVPAGSRVALRGSGRRVFVFRGATFVNGALVRGGYAEWDARGDSRLERRLDRAEDAAIARGRGLWAACQGDKPSGDQPAGQQPATQPPTAVTAPPAGGAQTPANPGTNPGGTQTGDAPAGGPRMSQTQWTAFIERSRFTTARSSGSFGGSTTQTDWTFCPGGRYGYKSESFNNGFYNVSEEVGRWRIVSLARRTELRADEAKLELAPTTNEPAFTVYLYSYDDGRVAVGNQFAQKTTATCPNG